MKKLKDGANDRIEYESEAIAEENSDIVAEESKDAKETAKAKAACKKSEKKGGIAFGILGLALPVAGLAALAIVGMLSFMFSFSYVATDVITEVVHFLLTFATAATALCVIPLGLLGIIFSICALAKKNALGILGLIVSIIATVVSTLVMTVWLAIVIITQILSIVIPIIVIVFIIVAIAFLFFLGMPLVAV